MAKPAGFPVHTHAFFAVNSAIPVDIVRRIRFADGVEDAPVYYGVHGLDRAHDEAEAAGLTAVWYRGRVWLREIVAGGELVWRSEGGGPTSSGIAGPAHAALQPSLIGAW